MASFLALLVLLMLPAGAGAQQHIRKLTQPTLMNEVRVDPSPLNGQRIAMNPPRLAWPDKYPHLGPVLDGVEGEEEKPQVTYRVRLSRDKAFKKGVMSAERHWAFFNPFKPLETGTWYWQHAYVDKDGKEEWSPVYHFSVDKKARVFSPPSLKELLSKLPASHPRILLDKSGWDAFIANSGTLPEAQAYLAKAQKAMKRPLNHLEVEIDTTQVVKLTNVVQYQSTLIRESRKVVDREEGNIEALVRAYLLTKEKAYYREAMKRLSEVLSWKESKYFAGDFNRATILSMSTSAYDAFYDLLTVNEKTLLLNSIRENGTRFYEEYVNHLENRIADNHVWQMTLRILTMAAFATVGDLPEADTWVDYCYNVWISRFPGLNRDGGWHNGDSYFHVNIRTLIEVPAFYSRITGFDFFADPWYTNNALYVIYEQPPFSKSSGQGNSHETKRLPNAARVGYAEALARQCNNVWAAAYVRYILEREPDILGGSVEGKAGDLSWYRCVAKGLPQANAGAQANAVAQSKGLKQSKASKAFESKQGVEVSLNDLPNSKVFNETGIATMHTALGDPEKNAMLSFRSSSYGSTSHALANQNAFNTFYGGKEIFYSSGHRTGFTDDHGMYAYRNTRAHNSILVDGMTQKIGTEGYGWIPRWYEGEQLSYVVGDASNAYGEVSAPIWLERARLSGTQFTPENGWDKNKLKGFRRHLIQLGKTGVYVIYDELTGTEPVTWSYLLHTTSQPMEVNTLAADAVVVTGRNNAGGTSVAHLFASEKMQTAVVDTFFSAPTNWKNVTNAKGQTLQYANHWHFSATTPKAQTARFLTIIDTHGKTREAWEVTRQGNTLHVAGWTIDCNLNAEGAAAIRVTNNSGEAELAYSEAKHGGATLVKDKVKGKRVKRTLKDELPDFEI